MIFFQFTKCINAKMVRKYIKKRSERNYAAKDMAAAVNDVVKRQRSYLNASEH